MTDRSASQSLKGYYYQFDKTILEILRLPNTASYVTVEGIEDVDVNTANDTTAIQCKYYAAQRFQESSLRQPISLMLYDFVTRILPICYQLYAHFGGDKEISTEFTVPRLKRLLTYIENSEEVQFHIKHDITDGKLRNFIKSFRLVIGPDYDVQHNETIDSLKNHFNCDEDEADYCYYNNALRVIYDTAVKRDRNARKIIKGSFLSEIDKSVYLFNKWYLRLKKRDKYIQYLRSRLHAKGAFQTQKSMAVYIPSRICSATPNERLGQVILDIAIARFGPGRLHDAKPLTFILEMDQDQIREVKSYLLEKTMPFNDGYESVRFTPKLFDRNPLIYRAMNRNGRPKDSISDASYYLRLVSKSTYCQHIKELDRPDISIDFSGEECQPEITLCNDTYRIANCQIDELLEIFSIGARHDNLK